MLDTRSTRLLALAAVLWLAVPAVASAPQDDESRGEIEQGREADKQIEAQFGFYEDEELQQYVDGIGERLARMSERPSLPWTFRVLDSPSVNAFALPGGFVYVTRGLLAYANSEAELAGVLGHEIGHITGKHGRSRQTRSTLFSLGLLAGALFSGTVRDLMEMGLPQQVAGLVLLKYSRDQELDADERGIRYATSAGYNPYGIGGFFETLQSLEEQSDRRKVPGWVSTHPQVDDRIERSDRLAAEQVARYGSRPEDLFEGHTEHLSEVDGIVFGENPREGYLDGDDFLHPDLRFALTFPSGWQVDNGRAAVTAVDSSQYAHLKLELAALAPDGDAESYVRAYLRGLRADVEDSRRTEINELDAIEVVFGVRADNTEYAVLGTWIEYDGRLYQLLGVTSPRRWRNYAPAFQRSMESFREVRDREILAVAPARLSVVEVQQRLQLAGVVEQHPELSVRPATVAILNHLELDGLIDAGSLVKLVFGGPSGP